MIMKWGERWHCTNKACRWSFVVENSSQIEGSNPLCTCGRVMKKSYSPPVFRAIEISPFPEPELVSKGSGRD